MSPLSREQKTLAEKQRRNKVNDCYRKLSSLVPTVATADKRIDKSSVLRLAASYLRLHKVGSGCNGFLPNRSGWRPTCSDNDEWKKLLLEATGGFVVLVNDTAHVIYVTEEVKTVLGHVVVDVVGRSIFSFVHPDDCEAFAERVNSMREQVDMASGSCPAEASRSRCDFFCSMLVGSSSDAHTSSTANCVDQYELVHVIGHLKSTISDDKLYTFVIEPCVMRAVAGIALDRRLGTHFMRTSLDGHLIFTDHWIAMTLGHLPSELIGISGYDFLFDEDILLGLLAHRHLLYEKQMIVIPCRLMTRTKSLVFVIVAAKILHSASDCCDGEDTVFINIKEISNKEGEKALEGIKRRLSIVESNSNCGLNLGSISAESSSSCLSPIQRPRGRPRKPRPQPRSAVGRDDDNLDASNWIQNLKANNDLRTACKEILERDARLYNQRSTINVSTSDEVPIAAAPEVHAFSTSIGDHLLEENLDSTFDRVDGPRSSKRESVPIMFYDDYEIPAKHCRIN